MESELPAGATVAHDARTTRHQYRLIRAASAMLVRACGAFSLLVGLLVLFGWIFDVPGLRSVLPGAVEMKANTAVALVLSGMALLLHAAREGGRMREGRRGFAQALGVMVAVLGVATAAQYVFGVDLGIDESLVRDNANAYNRIKGRMSPYSAAAFAFLGTALAALPFARLGAVVNIGAGAAGVIGLVSMTGYLWGAAEIRTDAWAPPVAIHTALAFLLLGLGTWIAHYRFWGGSRSLRFLQDAIQVKVMASFVMALVLLIAVGGLAYRSAEEYARHAERLEQVKVFRGHLTDLYAALADAIFTQRRILAGAGHEVADAWAEKVETLTRARRLLTIVPVAVEGRAAVAALDTSVARLARLLQEELDAVSEGTGRLRDSMDPRTEAAMATVRQAMERLDELERIEEEQRAGVLTRGRQRTLAMTVLALVAAAVVLGAVFVAIRREMTARVQAERVLRRRSAESAAAHRFLESVVQNIPHMIFVKEATHLRFVRLNLAGQQLTGLSEEAILGKTDYDFFPREDADFFVAKDREVLAAGKILDIPEEQLQSARDGLRLLHTKKIPLVDETGRRTHLLGIAEDVTEARAREREIAALHEALRARAEEVERASRARSAFLATMSHEIRTPMNGMLGMLELLGLGPLDPKQRGALGVIGESGRALLRIIDDILDLSKIEAGKLELREEPASVACILEEIRNIHAAVASRKGVTLSVTLDPAVAPAVWVDALRLRQILNNFVSNAVKFTPQGHVHLRAEVLAGGEGVQQLRVSVTDTGVGIAPEEQERLFEPFVQATAGAQAAAGGTGLGLTISRRLAELMGGTVRLASELGRGTTLTLELQVRTAAAELLPPSAAQEMADLRQIVGGLRRAPAVAQAQAEGTLILLVDDHPVNRLLMQQQVESLGYAAEAAVDGLQGLALWESGRFGLVLTDCQMPGLSGYELAHRIREQEAASGRRRTPVIGCTAMALEGEVEKCREAGMDDVVFKPVPLREMLHRLQAWLPAPVPPVAEVAPRAAIAPPAAPEPAPAPGGRPCIDTARLGSVWGADPQRIRAIVGAYVLSAREDRAALHEALGRSDLEAVRAVMHRMIGASRMVHAHGMDEVCQLVTAAAWDGHWPALDAAVLALDAELARLDAEFGGPA
ncbi:MAG TPA: ATP-binding protein [Ramlibacter sp.]|uniref:hybrid sensor histidine kinase/response regulator n=1 Tax=Ramlibacter sp. TaxID=1917967 RepID=UPI002ED266AB